ncbi:ComEC/Rec2 family competence protein [Actinocrinis sp.]|uniref:ComEC/Rec2 family competence protein n=1 Tax=Actinocrinis sp. TaxID=1920516 RepID=UPI002D55A428|nr:ComEC/Rec2 family competence protein [Actinocrinis sp.]HZP51118.1 ComEC/Rec2 family competence protein [Actinocrinis sp.]
MLAGWAATWIGLSLPPEITALAATAIAIGGVAGMVQARRRVAAHPLAPEPWSAGLCAMLLVAAGLALSAALHVAVGSNGPVPGLAAESAFVGTALTVTGDPRRVETSQKPCAAAPPEAGSGSQAHGASGFNRNPASSTLILVPVRITLVTTENGASYQVGTSATVMAKPHSGADLDAWLTLLPSEHLIVSGRLEPARGGTRDAALLVARGAPKVIGGPSTLQSLAGSLRADLREAASTLPAEEAGVLPALTVGDTSHEPTELADALKRTGLTYLTVVSGENLVFTTAALLPLARWLGLRGRAVTGASAVFVLGFTVLARPGPPMVRATVMSLLGCIASLSGRRFRALATMAAAVLILLLIDPWLAHTYGFALSVAATAGLLIVAPGWCDRMLDRGVPLWAAGPAAATAAAEVFCEPLLVIFTGSLPLIAVPCNVLAVPAAPAATVLGVSAMAADVVSPALGHAVAWVAQWPVRWICLVARTGAEVPGAAIGWPTGLGGCGLLLACYVAAWRLLLRVRVRLTSATGGSTPLCRTGLDKIGLV